MKRGLERYRETVFPELREEYKYSSPMQVPKLQKIVINCGVGEATQNAKALEHVTYGLRQISGQKPIILKARKSIANFKLREGMSVGCKVTLRRKRMYDFLDRLVSVALPRVRDFRGIPAKGFDGRGNYTLGIREQIVFPEVDIDKLDTVRGMEVTFVTTARNDDEARSLLRRLGMPFKK